MSALIPEICFWFLILTFNTRSEAAALVVKHMDNRTRSRKSRLETSPAPSGALNMTL